MYFNKRPFTRHGNTGLSTDMSRAKGPEPQRRPSLCPPGPCLQPRGPRGTRPLTSNPSQDASRSARPSSTHRPVARLKCGRVPQGSDASQAGPRLRGRRRGDRGPRVLGRPRASPRLVVVTVRLTAWSCVTVARDAGPVTAVRMSPAAKNNLHAAQRARPASLPHGPRGRCVWAGPRRPGWLRAESLARGRGDGGWGRPWASSRMPASAWPWGSHIPQPPRVQHSGWFLPGHAVPSRWPYPGTSADPQAGRSALTQAGPAPAPPRPEAHAAASRLAPGLSAAAPTEPTANNPPPRPLTRKQKQK